MDEDFFPVFKIFIANFNAMKVCVVRNVISNRVLKLEMFKSRTSNTHDCNSSHHTSPFNDFRFFFPPFHLHFGNLKAKNNNNNLLIGRFSNEIEFE